MKNVRDGAQHARDATWRAATRAACPGRNEGAVRGDVIRRAERDLGLDEARIRG